MAVTSKFLRDIMAQARPIIERQMADAKLIAGLRNVVASNGGDWGALKALIKAHVEDENDETGDGKRVQKIVDKADDTAAYADMLGLANMNENNFSAEQFPPHDPETGEITDTQEHPSTGSPLDAGCTAPSESVADAISESAQPSHEPVTAGEGGSLLPLSSPAINSAMQAKTKADVIRLLRPFCQNADDLTKCGGQGSKHCVTCEAIKQSAKVDA